MEEDIKVLEALIEEHKKLGDTSEETRISQPLFKIIIKAIENLIARNKELEQELNSVKEIYYTQKEIETNYIPNERLIHYMDVALENSKQCLRKGNKIRANEEYKRYKDLKDMVDDLVYHKTLAKGENRYDSYM